MTPGYSAVIESTNESTNTSIKGPFRQYPNDLAASITGRPYLSWSQIRSFRSCPRAFAFRYVEQVEPAFVASALLHGGAIHAALEAHFEHRMIGSDLPLDDLVTAYREAWHERLDQQGDVPVRYNKGEDAERLMESAGQLLEAFLASPLAEPAGSIIGIEETLTGPLAADLPDLLAIIDLIVADGDDLRITDFKTSRSKWGDAKVSEAAEQLRLYRVMSDSLTDDDPDIHLTFGVLVKTKTPSVQVLDVPDSPANPDHLAHTIRPVWRAMQFGIDYTNPSLAGCAGCLYRDRCPTRDG